MLDDLEQELQLFELERQAAMDAISNTLQGITNRLDTLFAVVAEMRDEVHTLLERTTPKSTCVFCTLAENVDGHFTGRCHRYLDPVSRAMRVSELHLCARCLRPEHGSAICTVSCNLCRGSHNTVLCSGPPMKKRKV
ncbi:hypothetical protein GCK32_022882 [Trichostrongylus colubriformis]|uniref:Uncharacterized protein n=1 Tax=Trichostrongylus colubriformis TaxID=6319 RepID=A0AAN8FB65_TRICO